MPVPQPHLVSRSVVCSELKRITKDSEYLSKRNSSWNLDPRGSDTGWACTKPTFLINLLIKPMYVKKINIFVQQKLQGNTYYYFCLINEYCWSLITVFIR